MNYEAYQGKVLRVANVLKRIFKHIALIIGVISAVVLLVIAFLSTKGMILEVGEVKSQITYGENMTFDVDALFSRVEYEYSALESDEWSTDEPTLVGKYKVRAKTFSSFGKNKYTEEYTYEIAPIQIDINVISENIVYGEFPKISTSLVKNDKLECTGFIFEDITQKKTNVKADIGQITIYDENNRDVTFCYTINTENKGVNITPRPLAITVSSQTMVYNGQTLAFDGYEISDGTLAYADRLGAEFDASITDIGSVINRPDLKVRNAEGIDVTTHYTMNVSVGTLTVTQRPIVVVTPTDEKIYDGEKLENTSVVIYYGEEITTEEITTEEVTLGGYIEETTDPWWLDESTEDIGWETEYISEDIMWDTEAPATEGWWESEDVDPIIPGGVPETTWDGVVEITSYDENLSSVVVIGTSIAEDILYYEEGASIILEEPVPEIEPGIELIDRDILEELTYPLETTPAGEPTTYPNKENAPSSPQYVIDTTKQGIIDGHTITFDRVTSITDAGVVDNIIHIGIYDENGVNKIGNYSFFYDFGTLTVKKREVTVTTPDASWVYDGQSHSTEVIIGGDGIADGQTEQSSKVSIENVDTFTNTYYINDILDADGNSVIHNYNITTQFGTIEIRHRPIVVSSDSGSYVYDGDIHALPQISFGSFIDYNQAIPDDADIQDDYRLSLVDGHTIEVSDFPTVLDYTGGTVSNTLKYIIKDEDGVDVTDNYRVTDLWGTLEVTKRPVTLSSLSGSFVYNGYSNNDGIITVGGEYGLAPNESFNIEYFDKFINATDGDVENTYQFTILNDKGELVIDNYDITLDWGTINVAKRPITLRSDSGSYVYDGYSHNSGNIYVEGEYGIASGESLQVIAFEQFKNATDGVTENTPEFDIVGGSGNSVISNYEITYEWGSVSVAKRPLTYRTDSYSDVYNGFEHSLPDPIFDDDAFDGMAFTPVVNVTSAPKVKDYTPEPVINRVEFRLFDDKSADITDNFEISCTDEGTLYVRQRQITVSTPSGLWQYDGMNHSVGQITFGGEGITLVNFYSVTSYTKVKNNTFGPVDNIVEYSIVDFDGKDVKYNYEVISADYGTLEITPVYINIESYDSAWIYDGYWHSSDINIYDANSGEHIFGNYYSDPDGFVMWHSLYGDTVDLSIHSAALGWTDGSVENFFEVSIYNGDGVDAINELQNYVVNNIYRGSLEIYKRPIQYTTGTNSWVYDGQYHYCDDVILNENEYMGYYALADGDRIVVTSYPSIIDYKQSGMTNVLEFAIFNKDGDNVTDWYDIGLDGYGTLSISKRRVYYTSATNTWEYDGEYHSDNSFTVQLRSGSYYLVDGDILTFENCSQIKNVGYTTNRLSGGSIYSSQRGIDVTDNYSITAYNNGKLTITPRKVTIQPVYASKVYDGETLSVNDWEYASGSKTLLDGHTLSDLVFLNCVQVNAGRYETSIDVNGGYIVIDEYGNNITSNYEILSGKNEILIEKLKITISSHSASKVYNGTELICHEYDVEYINGSAVAGHNISLIFTGRIIGVGIVDNTFEDVFIYSNNDPYTNLIDVNYTLDVEYGKLEIEGIYVGKLWSAQDGYEYIKTQSYGDYLGYGFADEPEYPHLTHDGFTADYLVSIALQNKGYSVGKQLNLLGMEGKMYFESTLYKDRYFNFPDDIYGDVNFLKGYLGEYANYEDQYRGWVYDNYLSINDYDTWAYMIDIINTEGFDASSYKIYDEVAKYIQNSASYGFDFDPALDYDSNIAIAFLEHTYGEQGVCRHYATAATMLYRALGIPARYTEGYLVKTDKTKQWHDVTAPGHAWVEVYIDELGWIPVEVTAGAEGFEIDGQRISNAGLGGIGNGGGKTELHFAPKDMTVDYTGEYVVHNGQWNSDTAKVIKDLQNKGYIFEVIIGNDEAKDIGKYNSYIEDVRVYYEGKDVTYQFNIDFDDTATIEIVKYLITVKPVDDEKVFDGTPLYAPHELESEDLNKWLMQGYRFEYDIIGDITSVGSIETYIDMYSFRVYDPDGIDVTANFTVIDESGTLTVTPFVIDIFLYRNQKEYDGNPLDYISLNKTYFSVRNELPYGFTVSSFESYLAMTNAGYYTVEDLNSMAFNRSIFAYEVIGPYGEYATDNFTIRFVRLIDKNGVEKDYIPMEVTARKLTITTASESRVDNGTPLENNTFHIQGAGFAAGQYIEIVVDGVCNNAGEIVENKIKSYTVYDADGTVIVDRYLGIYAQSGMTENIGNYELTLIFGTLELLPNDSDIE